LLAVNSGGAAASVFSSAIDEGSAINGGSATDKGSATGSAALGPSALIAPSVALLPCNSTFGSLSAEPYLLIIGGSVFHSVMVERSIDFGALDKASRAMVGEINEPGSSPEAVELQSIVLCGLSDSDLQFWLMGMYHPMESGARLNCRPVYQHSSKRAYLVYAQRACAAKTMYWWVSHQLGTEDEMSGWLRIEDGAISPEAISGAWEVADGKGSWVRRALYIKSAAVDVAPQTLRAFFGTMNCGNELIEELLWVPALGRERSSSGQYDIVVVTMQECIEMTGTIGLVANFLEQPKQSLTGGKSLLFGSRLARLLRTRLGSEYNLVADLRLCAMRLVVMVLARHAVSSIETVVEATGALHTLYSLCTLLIHCTRYALYSYTVLHYTL
jgi:hypothetical protein